MLKDRVGCFEEHLFTSVEFYRLSWTTLQFFDCVLIVDIGEHKVGERFDSFVVTLDKEIMDLYRWNADGSIKETYAYRMLYTVGEKIS